MPGWALDDVEARALQNPESFFIPSEPERQSQKTGDLVQLHFLLTREGPGLPRAERMWVKITSVEPDGHRYRGVLTNRPAYIEGLQVGSSIEFEPRHIARVLVSKGDPGWLDCGEQLALVSRLVFDANEAVRFAYRQEPADRRDSGWRLLTGRETDDYTDDPANIRLCLVAWLADLDPSLREILTAATGSVFEREGKGSPWRMVEGWEPREG